MKAGIDAGKKPEEIALDMPWYKEWTGVAADGPAMNKDSIKHVYDELTGKIDHDKLGRLPYTPPWPGLGTRLQGDALGR